MINTVKLDSFPQTYAAREGPHQQRAKDIYHELRKNVVNNVVKVGSRESADKFDTVSDTLVQWQEYDRTGFVWEQYDAVTGEGRRR